MMRRLLLSLAVVGALAFADTSSAEARGGCGGGYYRGHRGASYYGGGRSYHHGGPSYYHRSYRSYPSYYGGHHGGFHHGHHGHHGISLSFGF